MKFTRKKGHTRISVKQYLTQKIGLEYDKYNTVQTSEYNI